MTPENIVGEDSSQLQGSVSLKQIDNPHEGHYLASNPPQWSPGSPPTLDAQFLEGTSITRNLHVPTVATPTAMLRFVERGGKRILQQCWHVQWGFERVTEDWRDIPLHVEDMGDGA